MAYTKEQREKNENALRAEIESKLKAEITAELENKIRSEYDSKLTEKSDTAKATAKKIQKNSRIPLDTIIPVVCNVDGGLFYESQRIKGYTIKWDSYGSVEYVELMELVSMRNIAKRFFEDIWIVLEDTDEYSATQLYDFLKVSKYYESSYTPETIDSVFNLDANQIIKTVSGLPKGMKDSIATRAKLKIESKELDSNSKIRAFETALNVQFSI